MFVKIHNNNNDVSERILIIWLANDHILVLTLAIYSYIFSERLSIYLLLLLIYGLVLNAFSHSSRSYFFKSK